MTLFTLLAAFVGCSAVVWRAGTALSNSTDALAKRFGLGEALGGLILLAVATNLPEIAITVSAALRGTLDVAVGNILGGIAVQTVVLALLDSAGCGEPPPLSSRVSTLVPVLEAGLVVAVLAVVVMGHFIPASLSVRGLAPADLIITATWLAGLWVIKQVRTALPWKLTEPPPSSGGDSDEGEKSTGRSLLVFGVAALVTLAAGTGLLVSGDALADRLGMSGVLFGATVLAAATALPEVSTGLAAVKIGDHELAISDIFGGNAFLPVLFLIAALLSGHPILPEAKDADLYLTALGMLVTLVYAGGLVIRSTRRPARMGVDSLLVVAVYAVGIAGLVAVAHR